MSNVCVGYFDYAATTPLSSEAKEAMDPFLTDKFYNPSALYLAAQQNKKALNGFRSVISQGLGAKPTEVFFTAGGTEANNLAIQGTMNVYKQANVLVSAVEHESVIAPAGLYDFKLIPVDQKGMTSVETITKLIDDETLLVSVMYANNEVGAIQPIRDISQLIANIREDRKARGINMPIYFHCDACQAVNYLDMQVSKLGVDLLTVNAGKIYGPKQCGALYIKTGVQLKPIILGGGQEQGRRSGTENLANIAGFAAAWDQARQNYHAETKRITELRDGFINSILKNFKGAIINGPQGNKRLANNINVTLPGIDNEKVLMMLDEMGFQVAIGSACSANHGGASHVLSAMGISKKDAQSTLRISLGKYTSKQSIDDLIKALIKVAK